ncbi:hypothetical protein LCGC14_1455370 [marine sediment metagenome]|uniref:Uncharacterized protein n=1 Tax=marine sediment metagenome TaxID=412755 RepID=A0A0F9JHD3_9ZZZZ
MKELMSITKEIKDMCENVSPGVRKMSRKVEVAGIVFQLAISVVFATISGIVSIIVFLSALYYTYTIDYYIIKGIRKLVSDE